MQRMGQPYRGWLTLVALASLLCGLPAGSLAQDNADRETERVQSSMKWIPASNSTALCNDFTQAGFFIRQNFNAISNNWVVFLESGGLCFNSETCNRRFFTRKVRYEYHPPLPPPPSKSPFYPLSFSLSDNKSLSLSLLVSWCNDGWEDYVKNVSQCMVPRVIKNSA